MRAKKTEISQTKLVNPLANFNLGVCGSGKFREIIPSAKENLADNRLDPFLAKEKLADK